MEQQKTRLKSETSGMVNIGEKEITRRVAIATATIEFAAKVFDQLLKQGSPKGDVFETAKVAGIMAAKSTPQIIPLCHPLNLTKINIRFDVDKKMKRIQIMTEVHCLDRTGVEMEALFAASTAALTIYDMMKWADKSIKITDIKLLEKQGGKSGHFRRVD